MRTISLKNSSHMVRFMTLVAVCMLFMLVPLVAVYAGGGGSGGGGGGGGSSSSGGGSGGGGGGGISYPPPSLVSQDSNYTAMYDAAQVRETYLGADGQFHDSDTGSVVDYAGESSQAKAVIDGLANSMFANVEYDLVQFPAGNISVTVGSACSGCTEISQAINNGDGTQSTFHTFVQSGTITPTGGNHGGSNPPPTTGGACGVVTTCPIGETRQTDGTCLSPHLCPEVHSGGRNGGSGSMSPMCCPLGTAPANSGGSNFCSTLFVKKCPTGQIAYPDGTCQPPSTPQCPAGSTLQPDGTCFIANTCPSVTGTLDNASCTAVSGWACDTAAPTSPLTVNFYADGAPSSGTLIGSTVANVPAEAAVGTQCGGNVDHRFSFTTPNSLKDGKTHTISAYALDNNGGVISPQLTGSPKTIVSCTPPPPPVTTLYVKNTTANSAETTSNITIGVTDQIQLRWTATNNPTSCTASANPADSAFSTGNAVSGTDTTVTEPAAGSSRTYSVTCSNASGSDTKSITVTRKPNSCTLDGITLNGNDDSYSFYNVSSVAYDESCPTSKTRTCHNGVLIGDPSYQYSDCKPVPPPPVTGITITATPSVVRYGNTSTLIWNIGNADSCTVSGPLLPATSITVTKNGSTAISNIESQSTYTLNCVLGPKGNQSTGSASTTIQVLPSVQET